MSKLLTESGSAPVKSGNLWRAVLITPGKGSSGIYTERMLRESGPKAFVKGTHSYVDHPRDEGDTRSPKNLIGVLAEDAHYEDGVGLVAELSIMPHWREFVEAVAPHTGLSIYAMGEGDRNEDGDVVVETLMPHVQNSVDLVSYPGRSGSKLAQKLYAAAISMINSESYHTDDEKKKKRKVLVILDTLDHVDQKPIRDIFTQHWSSISRPKVSLLIVAPLFIIHMQELMAEVQDNYTLLPNIRVNRSPGSEELDMEGFKFFKEVIRRLASLDLFTSEALEAIFRLSGGMLRDMIGIAGDACRHADRDDPEGKVQPKHVQKVFDTRVAHFRRLLSKSDYKTLQEIADNPYPLGIDGMAALLHLKAILYFPNGEGWYEVHPAVKAILDKAAASASK
jgi:hypothetical protein